MKITTTIIAIIGALTLGNSGNRVRADGRDSRRRHVREHQRWAVSFNPRVLLDHDVRALQRNRQRHRQPDGRKRIRLRHHRRLPHLAERRGRRRRLDLQRQRRTPRPSRPSRTRCSSATPTLISFPPEAYGDLKQSTVAINFQIVWMRPLTDRLDLSVFGGPSIIRVRQEFASATAEENSVRLDQTESTEPPQKPAPSAST